MKNQNREQLPHIQKLLDRIAARRRELKITCDDMGKLLGMTRAGWSAKEIGRNPIYKDELEPILEKLQITLEEALGLSKLTLERFTLEEAVWIGKDEGLRLIKDLYQKVKREKSGNDNKNTSMV